MAVLMWVLALLLGCLPTQPDRDGDGVSSVDGDCDDDDPSIRPGADEVCDGIDQNCDGSIDEGVTAALFTDSDGDGFGDQPVEACAGSPNTAAVDGDCDDADPASNPEAAERCGDGIDQDCGTQPDCREEGEVPASHRITFTFDTSTDLGDSVVGLPDLDGDGRGEALFADWFVGSAGQSFSLYPGSDRWVGGSSLSALSAQVVLDPTAQWVGAAALPSAPPAIAVADNRGQIFLFDPLDLEATPFVIHANGGTGRFGEALRSLGDLDGDGVAELGIGDPAGITDGASTGAVWLLPGDAPRTDDLDDYALRIKGEGNYAGLGRALASGDVDGDGTLDLLVGANHDGADVYYAVMAFRMADTPTRQSDAYLRFDNGESGNNEFGAQVEAADLDLDGQLDLLIAAPSNYDGASIGVIYAVEGPFSPGSQRILGPSDRLYEGSGGGSRLAQHMVLLNQNGDAYPDLAISEGAADEDDEVERVWLRHGPIGPGATEASVSPAVESEWFASTMGVVSDVNGDGADELVIADGSQNNDVILLGWGD